jgi:hypothetical protein
VDFVEIIYNVSFDQNGIKNGTSWFVTVNGRNVSSTSSSIEFPEMNGSYSYIIGTVNGGSGVRYVAEQITGVVVVTGSGVTVHVLFYTQYYFSSFVSSGGGKTFPDNGWYNSSAKITINATAEDGFEFIAWKGVGVGNYSGNQSQVVVIINGPLNETATFGKLYAVQVSESGLISGSEWYFNTTNGFSVNSTSPVMNFTLVNGSYSYEVFGGNSYFEGLGVFNVSGQPTVLAIVFSLKTFNVTVQVSGLPKGDSWTVTLQGTDAMGDRISKTLSSTDDIVVFDSIPIGKYTYSISFPYGEGASSRSAIAVNVPGIVVKVATPGTVMIIPYVIIVGIIGGAGGVAGYVFFKRRKAKITAEAQSADKK